MARGKVPSRQPDNASKAVGYYFHGKAAERAADGLSLAEAREKRVAWHETFGLIRDDPKGIAGELEALSSHNPRLKRPYFHFVVSFDSKDAAAGLVGEERQRDFSRRIVERMGLTGYAGAAVAHKDTDNPHVHFVFSRVHPETGRTWSDNNSGRRLQTAVRELAREYGLNVSQQYERDDQRTPEAEHWTAKREDRAERRPFQGKEITAAREAVADDFKAAGSWKNLADRLAAKGYGLEKAGKGAKATLFLYDGEGRRSKLSQIFSKDKDVREAGLKDRFGQSFDAFAQAHGLEHNRTLSDGVSDRRRAPDLDDVLPGRQSAAQTAAERPQYVHSDKPAAERVDALKQAVAARSDFEQKTAEYNAALDQSHKAARFLDDLRTQKAALDRQIDRERAEIVAAIGDAFTDPEEARKAWETFERERDRAQALADKAFRPETFGRLKSTYRLGVKKRQRQQAERALARMREHRDRWIKARSKAATMPPRIAEAEQQHQQSRSALAAIRSITGTPHKQYERKQELTRDVIHAAERVRPAEIRKAGLPREEADELLRAHKAAFKQKKTIAREAERGRDGGIGWEWDIAEND